MSDPEVPISFLTSNQAVLALENLRKGDHFNSSNLGGLSPDDRTYLEAEDCVRNALYSQLESRIQPGVSPWVRKLVFCYRDLFTNPQRALDALGELEEHCPSHLDFPVRLKFWRTHLNLLLGRIEIGKRSLVQIASTIPEGIWKNEMLAIRAMGYYFTGRTRDALAAHHDCQNSIKESPDLFLQTFDCGMASRTALKLCDPANFEYFSECLDVSLHKKDDSRFRLRHTGYRAMIFNQLGEHETAELHWKNGDEQLHSTESALERGQYLVFRGMSYALVSDSSKAKSTFELARHELKLAGSPAVYLSELDIAEHLTAIANPATRSVNLKKSVQAAELAHGHFSNMTTAHVYPLQAMYSEALEFCDGILNGAPLLKSPDGRQSLVLSVIENISTSVLFAKELSHFRLIPDFVHKLSESDLTDRGLLDSMESVLRVRPVMREGQFHLPGALAALESQSEVKTILYFASTLFSLGEKANDLFRTKARLKEATRAKHLLHDVRFFSQELSKQAKGSASALDLSKLSDELNELIESYLQAMNSGENPAQPTIVHFPRLLEQVSEMTFKITGTRPQIPETKTLPFLWVSGFLLKRLLLNLMKNGIEAGSGAKAVSISYKVEELAGQERLVIYLSDNGTGLDPNTLEMIALNPDDPLESTKKQGTGLGLRSAVECAHEIGAELSIVPSTRSQGTTFRIVLPLPEVKMISKDPEILVIDDSRAVADAWTAFGVQERIQIHCVYAEEAVATLNQLPKGVSWIVLDYDLKLPNCTGADLAPSIIALGTKVALSTGFDESELADEVKAIAWDSILSKEPQYPVKEDRKTIAVSKGFVRKPRPVIETESGIRHELKNELTPLRFAVHKLLSSHPDNTHVRMLVSSIKGIEKLSRKKAVENNVAS